MWWPLQSQEGLLAQTECTQRKVPHLRSDCHRFKWIWLSLLSFEVKKMCASLSIQSNTANPLLSLTDNHLNSDFSLLFLLKPAAWFSLKPMVVRGEREAFHAASASHLSSSLWGNVWWISLQELSAESLHPSSFPECNVWFNKHLWRPLVARCHILEGKSVISPVIDGETASEFTHLRGNLKKKRIKTHPALVGQLHAATSVEFYSTSSEI